MEREELRRFSEGELSARKELLWNPGGSWPADTSDQGQAPHGRPIPYWVGTVGGMAIGWEGTLGWRSKGQALEAASRFREKCREQLGCLA